MGINVFYSKQKKLYIKHHHIISSANFQQAIPYGFWDLECTNFVTDIFEIYDNPCSPFKYCTVQPGFSWFFSYYPAKMRLVLHDYCVDFKKFGTKIHLLFEICSFSDVSGDVSSMVRRWTVNENSKNREMHISIPKNGSLWFCGQSKATTLQVGALVARGQFSESKWRGDNLSKLSHLMGTKKTMILPLFTTFENW